MFNILNIRLVWRHSSHALQEIGGCVLLVTFFLVSWKMGIISLSESASTFLYGHLCCCATVIGPCIPSKKIAYFVGKKGKGSPYVYTLVMNDSKGWMPSGSHPAVASHDFYQLQLVRYL